MNLPHLILGSKSPRRQQLLREAGFQYTTVTIDVEETFPDNIPAETVASYLAKKKAMAFGGDLGDSLLVTADTVVIIDGRILGKPENREEAVDMLQCLSGRSHKVITGVCLRDRRVTRCFDEVTRVYFKKLTAEEIHYYIDNYKPFDKAGAYGIQEWIGLIGIEKIEGSYFNVVGLPVHRIHRYLKEYK